MNDSDKSIEINLKKQNYHEYDDSLIIDEVKLVIDEV